jgi:hypothetical protein
MNTTAVLGIDIGRVIIAGRPDGPDTSFFHGDTAAMLRTPPVDGVYECVRRLTEWFEARVWLVSKCGPRIQRRSLDWLEHHRFFDRTGIDPDHVRFCLRREDKAIHCAELGITHFVDDRPDVHVALRGVVPNRYLFGPRRPGARTPPGVTATADWPTAAGAIADALSTAGARHTWTAAGS